MSVASAPPPHVRVTQAVQSLLRCTEPTTQRHDWSGLNTPQFLSAIRMVISQNPAQVAAAWTQVQERLVRHADLQAVLLQEIADAIPAVDSLALRRLSDAPWDVTKAILLNLQPLDSYRLIGNAWWDQPIPALELLTAVAYTIPDGLELAKAVMPKFEAIHAVIRYRSALQGILRATGTENPEGPLSTYLMTTAKDWLTAAGYQAGIVCTGLHRDRPQLFVGDGTTRYVADRSSACHPEEGEHVLFHPRSGKPFPPQPWVPHSGCHLRPGLQLSKELPWRAHAPRVCSIKLVTPGRAFNWSK